MKNEEYQRGRNLSTLAGECWSRGSVGSLFHIYNFLGSFGSKFRNSYCSLRSPATLCHRRVLVMGVLRAPHVARIIWERMSYAQRHTTSHNVAQRAVPSGKPSENAYGESGNYPLIGILQQSNIYR